MRKKIVKERENERSSEKERKREIVRKRMCVCVCERERERETLLLTQSGKGDFSSETVFNLSRFLRLLLILLRWWSQKTKI